MEGKLFLCPTPIGNLEDITQRVLNTLREVELIAAEDTRNSLNLLRHFSITTPMISYHQHNERERTEELVGRLKDGLQLALITDAGMPGISDPGQILVHRCHEEGIEVTALPGPCAFVTALALSGLDSRRFTFEGFLPHDKKEREPVLERLRSAVQTTIFYEAPHRLVRTLQVLAEAAGDRPAAAVRELTKRYEEVRLQPLAQLAAYYADNEPRGEFVILIEGRTLQEAREEEQREWQSLSLVEHMARYVHLPEKEAMKEVARERGLSRREIYQQWKIGNDKGNAAGE